MSQGSQDSRDVVDPNSSIFFATEKGAQQAFTCPNVRCEDSVVANFSSSTTSRTDEATVGEDARTFGKNLAKKELELTEKTPVKVGEGRKGRGVGSGVRNLKRVFLGGEGRGVKEGGGGDGRGGKRGREEEVKRGRGEGGGEREEGGGGEKGQRRRAEEVEAGKKGRGKMEGGVEEVGGWVGGWVGGKGGGGEGVRRGLPQLCGHNHGVML